MNAPANQKLPVAIPEPADMAEAIRRISDAAGRLMAAGLNRKALCVLLSHSSGESQRTVSKVLDSLASLAAEYTTRKSK